MKAKELLPKLRHLTLSGKNDEGELEFIGTEKQWRLAEIYCYNLNGDCEEDNCRCFTAE